MEDPLLAGIAERIRPDGSSCLPRADPFVQFRSGCSTLVCEVIR